MSDTEAVEAAPNLTTDEPAPEASAAAVAVAGIQEDKFERALLSTQEMFLLAAKLNAQIAWTFDEENKVYLGSAPYGTFKLFRHADSKALKADYVASCGTFKAKIGLDDQDSVSAAKAGVTLKLVEAYNQVRRDDPLLAGEPAEADLI